VDDKSLRRRVRARPRADLHGVHHGSHASAARRR